MKKLATLAIGAIILTSFLAKADDACTIYKEEKTITLQGPCNMESLDHTVIEKMSKEVPYSLKMEVDCHSNGAELKPDPSGKCHVTIQGKKPQVVGEVQAIFHIALGGLGLLQKNEMARIFMDLKIDGGNAVTAPLRAVKMVNGNNTWSTATLARQEKDKAQSQGLQKRVIHFKYELSGN